MLDGDNAGDESRGEVGCLMPPTLVNLNHWCEDVLKSGVHSSVAGRISFVGRVVHTHSEVHVCVIFPLSCITLGLLSLCGIMQKKNTLKHIHAYNCLYFYGIITGMNQYLSHCFPFITLYLCSSRSFSLTFHTCTCTLFVHCNCICTCVCMSISCRYL